VTVAAAFVNLGQFNFLVAMIIACFKASLVIWYFMHVKYASRMTKLVVITADRGEVVLAVRDGTFQRAGDDRLDLRPALGRHGVPSSRRSHARATAHSRLIVAGERSSASAVSSMVIPPK